MLDKIDQALDEIDRPSAKGQLQPQRGAEEVGDHGKLRVFHLGEQQGWAPLSNDPSVNFSDLQVGINRSVDGQQLVCFSVRDQENCAS